MMEIIAAYSYLDEASRAIFYLLLIINKKFVRRARNKGDVKEIVLGSVSC